MKKLSVVVLMLALLLSACETAKDVAADPARSAELTLAAALTEAVYGQLYTLKYLRSQGVITLAQWQEAQGIGRQVADDADYIADHPGDQLNAVKAESIKKAISRLIEIGKGVVQ